MKRHKFAGMESKATVKQVLDRLKYDLRVTLGGENRVIEAHGSIFEVVQESMNSFPEKIFVRKAKFEEIATANTLLAAINYYESRLEDNGEI